MAASSECECCESIGLYDFTCMRCIARLYVAAFPREKLPMRARLHKSLSKEQFDEVKRHVEELSGTDRER